MINRTKHTLQHQLNTWIVTRFIEEIYNYNNLTKLADFVADNCKYFQEYTLIGESIHELQTHFAYTWVNQQILFENVEYEIREILTQRDIVSVKIKRKSMQNQETHILQDVSRWEMFQVQEGRIVQRWIAKT